MNCAHCGAPMTLEDKFCPHCGTPNAQAAQHSRDMAHYNREFEKTRRGVYGTLKAYKGITARLILLVIAIVIMIVVFAMDNSVYSLYRSHMQREARAHADEVEAQILEYMEHMDYVSLARYSEHYSLAHYRFEDDDIFGKYYPALVLARDYTNLYADMMPIATMDDPSERRSSWSIVCDDITHLYKHLYDADEYFYEDGDPDLSAKAASDIEKLTDALLIRYLKFDPDEAGEFHTMGAGKRSAFIEEKFERIAEERGTQADE